MRIEDLPERTRRALGEWLGEKITATVPASLGYSPGLVARLDVADGRQVFVKSVGEEINAHSAELYRKEIATCRALRHLPNAPDLLWSHDEGGWVTLVFEYVPGRTPSRPWEPEELRRVLAGMEEFARSMSPPPAPLPDIADIYGEAFTGWRALAALPADDPQLAKVDPWARERLARLAELEAGWAGAGAHDTLQHGDLRSDNMLISGDRLVFVDWPCACVGPAWFDLVAMLPSVRLEGGPRPWEVFDETGLGRRADPAAVTAVLAAITGFFVRQSLLPPPPGIPEVREFQARQGEVALAWLKHRWA